MNFDHDKSSIVSLGQIDLNKLDDNENLHYEDLPILPTRNLVLFPDITIPISLGRENSLLTARKASELKIPIGVLCQAKPDLDDPTLPDQFFGYGVVADVIKVIDLPDDTHTAIVHDRGKFKVEGPGANATLPEARLSARVKPVRDTKPRSGDKEFEALTGQIKEMTLSILESTPGAPEDFLFNLRNTNDPEMLINLVATHLPIEPTA